MSKIAIIGATGRAGSQLLEEALRRGHSVTAIARNASKIGKRAGVDGVYDGAGQTQFHSRSGAVAAAGPAGVDEPDSRVVLLDLVGEHLGVFGGVPD